MNSDRPSVRWITLGALCLAAGVFNASGAKAADLSTDVDYLTCSARPYAPSRLPSGLYDGVSLGKLKSDTFWETRNDMRALVRQRVIGERYERGDGVKPDVVEAISHYRRAAFTTSAGSVTYIPGLGGSAGSVSVTGPGGKRAGDPVAIRRLGEMYRDDIGLPMDALRAKALLACAARLMPVTSVVTSPPAGPPMPASGMLPLVRQSSKPNLAPVPPVGSAMLNRQVGSYSFPNHVRSIAWSPDGKYLAATHTDDKRVSLLDVAAGRVIWTAKKLDGIPVTTCCKMVFSPDGSRLYIETAITYYTKDRDKTVLVLDTRDGSIITTFGYHEPRSDTRWHSITH